jgi:ATP adenylyltransferase/5',5'''-P-1,P-4-tetraphosphate phosphorylase II
VTRILIKFSEFFVESFDEKKINFLLYPLVTPILKSPSVDENELIAVNHFQLQTKSKTCADIIMAVDYVLEQADLFNRHNVDYYLSGTGLAIDVRYRGKGN